MLSALIVDDEPVARRRLRRLLGSERDVEIAEECGDGRSAVEAIEARRPDLVFLDVEMPDISGFDVVESLGRRMPPVIFVTAYDHYALRAFDVHAIDYLLKPVGEERFREALHRARERLRHENSNDFHRRLEAMLGDVRANGRYLERIAVRTGESILIVHVSEIDWIGAADNYAALHVGAKEYLVRETMTWLERALDPREFVRIHRSTIVQLSRVREIRPSARGETVVLRDGRALSLGRRYRPVLERALGRKL